MDKELNVLLKSIKEKTGIDVTLMAEGMKFVISTENSAVIAQPSKQNFNGVFIDVETGNTYFTARYKKENLIGYLKGISVAQKNYAVFIQDLIENVASRELQLSQSEYLKSILLGECNRPQIQKYEGKYGLKEDGSCFVLALQAPGVKAQDMLEVLSGFGSGDADLSVYMDGENFAFIKFVDEKSADYQSSSDFAGFLAQFLKEETGVTVSIGIGGTVKGLIEAQNSYNQALMALRMATVMSSKGNVHSFKEYVLLKMFEDLPKFKLTDYLNVLLDENAKEIFADNEMTNTAEEFLENSLNVSETSRKLYLHRNTLMYRLDKIERETGLNIRKFSDAVTFRLITILFKLIK